MEYEKFLEQFCEVRYSRKYANKMSINTLVNYNDMSSARIHFLRKFEFKKDELETLRTVLREEKNKLEVRYSELVESESFRVLGKRWHPSFYQISGICRNEFSTEAKNELRANLDKTYKIQNALICINYVLKYWR